MRRENLGRFDAVFFNNTVGNLFEDPALRQSLLEFVVAGGGLLGLHGTSVAFTRWPGGHEDWPEFGRMLGARGASHRESDERAFLRLDDPGHPLNRIFQGQGFEYRDEFFRFHDPYSRNRVRVLLSIDTEKTEREQGRAFGVVTRPDDELRQIRLKLDDAGVRLLTYYLQDIPGDEPGCRRVFEFGRLLRHRVLDARGY